MNGEKMTTLSECLTNAVREGYTLNFMVADPEYPMLTAKLEDGRILLFKPEAASIKTFYRFEGESDPADNSILYLIETQYGYKGTLVDGYGPTADRNISKFITQVEDIQKKKLTDLKNDE